VDARPKRKSKQARHDEVLAAAATIFAERGYRATTIHDIGAALNMTGAGLYYYVQSKEDLLVEICQRAGNRLHEAAKQIMAEDLPPQEKLRMVVQRHLEVTQSDRAIFSILIQERSELPAERVEELLEGERAYFATVRALIEELGGPAANFRDARLAAFAMVGMLNWVLRWYQEDGAFQLADIADEFFRIFCGGIRPDLLGADGKGSQDQ
jgi:AcrR family transcriptional regulator